MNGIKNFKAETMLRRSLVAASMVLALADSARAAIIISEVNPSGSSGSANTYNADWFELTNTGPLAQDITGWKIDDNSHAFANAVALRGATSIAPGQSIVFVEGLADGSTDATIDSKFESFWFGSTVPAGFTIGNYGGLGVGLSQTADEVNIYDAAGNQVTGVGFGLATVGISFDNSAGIGSATQPDPIISLLSAIGVNGAFSSFNAATGQPHEIGSPGIVPEPGSALLFCLGVGVLMLSRAVHKRRS